MNKRTYDEERVARAMVFSIDNNDIKNILLTLSTDLLDSMLAMVQQAFNVCVAEGYTDIHAVVNAFIELGGNEIEMIERLNSEDFKVSFIQDIQSSVDRLNREGNASEYRLAVEEYNAGEITHAELKDRLIPDVSDVDTDSWNISDLYGAVENHEPGNIVQIGLHSFDNFHGGMERGRVTILAARPGVGKSDLALHAVRHNVKMGKNVVLISAEMDAREIGYRMGRAENTGKYGKAGTLAGIKAIQDAPGTLSVYGQADTSVAFAVSKVTPETDLVVVDYLQILTAKTKLNSYEMTTELSNDVRKAAKRSNAAWLVLSQLNRDSGDAKAAPSLRSLRGSGAIEQDAFAVLFLHMPDGRSGPGFEQHLELSVEKNRNGATGAMNVFCDRGNSRWRE